MEQQELKRSRWLEMLGPVVLALGVGAFGSFFVANSINESKLSSSDRTWKDKLEVERGAYQSKIDKLEATIKAQEERHEQDKTEQHRHLDAFNTKFVRMRDGFEKELAASRAGGTACTSRLDGIAENVRTLFGLVEEGDGLRAEAEGLRKTAIARVGDLEKENRVLADKIARFQQWERERTTKIVVTGKKK
jgi:hypothetical protein